MSEPRPQNLHNDYHRQLLTEFLVPALQGAETEVMEHIAHILGQFGFEPGQLSQILSAVGQSLNSLEDEATAYQIRISVTGVELSEKPSEGTAGQLKDLGLSGRGLGFFLVKRTVYQLQELEPEKSRLLEVLIYREGGPTKE